MTSTDERIGRLERQVETLLAKVAAHRLQKPVVVKDGGSGRRTLELRPAHCDVVRYERKGSWLRISPKSAGGGAVEAYRRLLGEALFNDADFFAEATYTLRPLQEHAQAALERSPSVSRARVTKLVWERSGTTHTLESDDCLAEIKTLGLPIVEGNLLEARIAVVLSGRRPARRTLKVKVPNRLDYPSDDPYAPAIDKFLDAAGIRPTVTHRLQHRRPRNTPALSC